ncbi:hypothetical protein Kim5_PA00504 (plasmid) [Rhizobium sp. Kim5]|nr:hypothetical protein Kim5_PA00504 [Rhizobium sp. Kim5]
MTATRSVVGRPQHQKGLSVCWTRACDGGGGNDLLWLPQARERPFDASKSSLEPDIRYRNDFAETTSQAPFYDAGEQGQRCLVNGTISPPLHSSRCRRKSENSRPSGDWRSGDPSGAETEIRLPAWSVPSQTNRVHILQVVQPR